MGAEPALLNADPIGDTESSEACTGAYVLVVEDQDLLREMLVQLLAAGGYRAVGVPHGQAALDHLRNPGTEKPCLILLALMMPVMDGWEFRRAQLADVGLAGIPVVVLTGLGESQANVSSLRIDRVVTKPPRMDQLLALVRTYCGPGQP